MNNRVLLRVEDLKKHFPGASRSARRGPPRERLQTMERTQDGFEIAEKDLQLRGPVEFFGVRQAGMPTFKAADLVADGDLLQSAREEAMRISDSEQEVL